MIANDALDRIGDARALGIFAGRGFEARDLGRQLEAFVGAQLGDERDDSLNAGGGGDALKMRHGR